jgi:hypothetical protein
MKAIIKSIPITEVNEGMQVLYEDLILTVAGNIGKEANGNFKDNEIAKFYAVGIYYQLKTIVVEYEGNDFGKHLVKQLPLKQSDWQQAIDLGLVDSGKEVEVEIVTIAGKGHGSKNVFAQLVPQQGKLYTKEDLKEAFKQSRQALIFEKDMPPLFESFEKWFELFNQKGKSSN